MAPWQDFTETRVPVRGGELAVVRWAAREPDAPDVPTIMLVHGITANALSWAAVADEIAGRADLIAVDLRGRAGSRASRAPGASTRMPRTSWPSSTPWNSTTWSSRVTHVEHSWQRLPPRRPPNGSVVLWQWTAVGFPLPDGVDPDAVLEAVVGPAVRELSMTFADEEACLDFHRVYPASTSPSSPAPTTTRSSPPASERRP